jgi:hypothetical protein
MHPSHPADESELLCGSAPASCSRPMERPTAPDWVRPVVSRRRLALAAGTGRSISAGPYGRSAQEAAARPCCRCRRTTCRPRPRLCLLSAAALWPYRPRGDIQDNNLVTAKQSLNARSSGRAAERLLQRRAPAGADANACQPLFREQRGARPLREEEPSRARCGDCGVRTGTSGVARDVARHRGNGGLALRKGRRRLREVRRQGGKQRLGHAARRGGVARIARAALIERGFDAAEPRRGIAEGACKGSQGCRARKSWPAAGSRRCCRSA